MIAEHVQGARRRVRKRLQSIADRIGFHYEQTSGEKWERMGRLQFDFLRSQGLMPHHYLLDVGCGTLRGGRHAIAFLEPGHYFGVEKETRRLDLARRRVLPAEGLESRNPRLFCIDNFDFSAIDQNFDFALAQSVINHLPPDLAKQCIDATVGRLAPGGRFFATYHPGELTVGNPHRRRDKEVDIAYHNIDWFRQVAEPLGADVEDIGQWGHPKKAPMVAFRKI
ncbi:MAG TPA: class I SAM-dependent methyltransferase [Polyangiaceae bacterium LLY-WYZ-14_1]|nr:class I SAM-dependent methyltransferase [Polyangiaceae bacterium LLY-WYZ-14_1]